MNGKERALADEMVESVITSCRYLAHAEPAAARPSAPCSVATVSPADQAVYARAHN